MKYLILLLLLADCSRSSQTFTEQVTFSKGFVMPDGKAYLSIPISTVTWDLLQGKPVNFLPTAHTHLWSDITNNPANQTLDQALEAMGGLPVSPKSPAEISKIVVPAGKSRIVFNTVDSVLQFWDGKK